jgi:putative endonuclease
MIFSVYAIRSEVDGRIYVGMSRDVMHRVSEHNSGKVFSTKGYRPWKLLLQEEVGARHEARKREKYFKSGVGKEYLKSLPR